MTAVDPSVGLTGPVTMDPKGAVFELEMIGGAFERRYRKMRPEMSVRPIARAAELIARFFCVGEALSIPLIRGTWHASTHPMPRAVLGRILRDEAAHGTFGFTFLDWATGEMTAEERAHVGRHADIAIGSIKKQWAAIAARGRAGFDTKGNSLGWMETGAYLALARRSMRDKVVRPLRAREIPIGAWTEADDAVSAS